MTASERLPTGVYDLQLNVELDGREMTLHPSAIETERGLLLLDTGLPQTFEQLEARLDDAGFDIESVATVLVTHQDGDHAGGLSDLAVRSDPFVVAHERDAPIIDGRTDPRGPDEADRYPPVRVDLELGSEATFATRAGPARVIPTPGHTPGHLSVYLPDEQFLVAADALTVDEDGLAGPRPDVSDNMNEALSSVVRLGELTIDSVLCYHGGFVDEGSDRITEIGEQ